MPTVSMTNPTFLPEGTTESEYISWVNSIVANPASVTWEVTETITYYTGRDSATGYVVHVVKSGTPFSIEVGTRTAQGFCQFIGTADSDNFVPLQTHLAGLV